MTRDEFLRQMGLSKDDVADPEVIVANLKEQRSAGNTGAAQASFFSRPRDKPYPGFASATPATTKVPMSEEGQKKYDDYVNRRVDNVTNGRMDDADVAYVPAQPPQRREERIQDSGSDEPKATSSASAARAHTNTYADEKSSYSAKSSAPTNPKNYDYEPAEESFIPKRATTKDNNDSVSVAQRIAQSSRLFYGAGDSDDESNDRRQQQQQQGPRNTQAQQQKGSAHGQSRADFLKSLGIDNVEERGSAKGPAGSGAGGTIKASVAMTGESRTEALSNAVAARRAERKAALAAARASAGGALEEDGSGYQPPRSAPSAVDIEPPQQSASAARRNDDASTAAYAAPSSVLRPSAYAQMPRASSEPSGDQYLPARGNSRATAPRVTIASEVTAVPAPAYQEEPNALSRYESNRPNKLNPSRVAQGAFTPTRDRDDGHGHESPTMVVNELLYGGGGTGARTAPPTYTRSRGGYDDSTSSSLNNTMNSVSSRAGGGGAEYDPETANLSPEELKTLGNKSFENGDFRKAVRYYSKAITKDPTNPALYSNRSAAYLQASKQMGMDTRSMALRDAEKTIELSPQWFKGYSRKGDALFKMERYDDAIDAYEAGLSYDEGNPSLLHSIGEARNAHGGIVRRDKKETPWAIEQKTNVDIKSTYGNKSAHELNDLNRGTLNEALGTVVMGDEYRKQQLERFKNQREVRASGTMPAAPTGRNSSNSNTNNNHSASAAATNSSYVNGDSSSAGAGQGKSLLDMIRSNSPKDASIPMNNYRSTSPAGGVSYGRRAGKESAPEVSTSDAAAAYQQSLTERYLARKAAAGK